MIIELFKSEKLLDQIDICELIVELAT